MRTARIAISIALFAALAIPASAQRLAIGQVDTGRLLVGQRIDLYVSIDANGPVDRSLLRVAESADGSEFTEVDEILDFDPVSSLDAPLAFYMLVDNSGSMYEERVSGGETRIDAAKQAIRDFANSITNRKDRIGLGVFNTRYRELGPPSRDKAALGPLLDSIEKPARAEGYTELYAALIEAASDASAAGRRTVVVLSDGENYPYSIYENEASPVYGETLYTYTDAIEEYQRQGLSVFAIHYGESEDPNLGRIAEATGGAVYRASGAEELAGVYQSIRETLLAEYRLSYRATMIPAARRIVRVTYSGNPALSADRVFFANTLFAFESPVSRIALGIVFLFGLIGLGVLLTLSIRGGSKSTSLVLIDSGGARGVEKTIALGSGETVIGSSQQADVTIAGNPTVTERHAVVSYEPGSSAYTIVSDSPVRVNNQPTTRRVLKPGDIVNIEGTILAFDEPDETDETEDPGKK